MSCLSFLLSRSAGAAFLGKQSEWPTEYGWFPTPIEGSCSTSDVFEITHIDQLLTMREELPCVLDAGLTPEAIPRGPAHGEPVHLGGGTWQNPLIESLWRGKLFTETYCSGSGESVPIMFNYILSGALMFPAHVAIDKSPVTDDMLAEGEPPVGDGEYLLVDYRNDYENYCPQSSDSQINVTESVYLKQFNNRAPFNRILDLVRNVGKTPDGNTIMLGRTLIRDTFGPKLYQTIAYFVLVSLDSEVSPNQFITNTQISPLVDFYYQQPGFAKLWNGFMPLTGLLKNPPTKQELKEFIYSSAKVYDYDAPIDSLSSKVPLTFIKSGLEGLKSIPFNKNSLSAYSVKENIKEAAGYLLGN